jgi:large subunit ribosomal protein L32
MAVPKKRTSRSKKNSRQATWVTKVNKQSKQAFSLASSALSEKSISFFYNLKSNEKSSITN